MFDPILLFGPEKRCIPSKFNAFLEPLNGQLFILLCRDILRKNRKGINSVG
jgi:hypothetical protein